MTGYGLTMRRLDSTRDRGAPTSLIQLVGRIGAALMLFGTAGLIAANYMVLELSNNIHPSVGSGLSHLADAALWLGAGILLGCCVRVLWSDD